MATLKFPSSGSEQTVAFGWRKRNSTSLDRLIFLPIPIAFELKDGATYTSIELGTTLSGVTAAALGDAFAKGGSSGLKVAQTLKRGLATYFEGKLDVIGATKEQRGFVTKKIASPYSNTAFSGHTIRTYNFSFLMAPSNLAEATSIQEIIKVFRRNLYGSAAQDVFLDYPPIWKIEFLTGGINTLKLNEFYPRLWPAYMTAFSSNSNPNAYGFYADGSPVEISIDLSFQETRALTQEDIISLENNNQMDVGVGETGLPLSGMSPSDAPDDSAQGFGLGRPSRPKPYGL